MANNANLKYLSSWLIDQLLVANETSVGAGTTLIYTAALGLTPPLFSLQFKPSGSNYWYQPGRSSTANTIASGFTFYGYALNGSVYAVTDRAGTVRRFVWADKVTY